MGERTADEKASFGKVKTGNVEDGQPLSELTENNIDYIMDQYRDESFKLLQDCVEKSRDKFAREYWKLEAANE